MIVYAIIGLIVVAVVAGTLALWAVWWLKKGSWEEKQSSNSTSAVTVEQSFTSGLASADTQNEVTGFLVAAIFATIVTVGVMSLELENHLNILIIPRLLFCWCYSFCGRELVWWWRCSTKLARQYMSCPSLYSFRSS